MALGPFARTVLADRLGDFERGELLEVAIRRASGVEDITFNVVDIRLDFDRNEATLVDVLEAGVEEVAPLWEFLSALAPDGPG